jgi:Pyruvate/2-oxoacid:ferredoxin oxidoreductase gamma subunit
MQQAGKKELMMGNEAMARGLIENGCSMATAYPGTPASEITIAVAKYQLQHDISMHTQWAVNKNVAFEIAYAGCQASLCTAVSMKQVGLNVALDSLMSAAYMGTAGGFVFSGVDGQGVLFITRLLAEAALAKGLPVFTSETHGMAQRGGTVISHLKVGAFTSPLVNPGKADGRIALKAESLVPHGGYLKPKGWAAVNSPKPLSRQAPPRSAYLDADRLAREIATPRALNRIMLGFTLSRAQRRDLGHGALHFTIEDKAAVLENRLKGKTAMLQSSIRALKAGSCG